MCLMNMTTSSQPNAPEYMDNSSSVLVFVTPPNVFYSLI